MTALLICACVLVGAAVVAIAIGGCILSGCLGLNDQQPDDWMRRGDDDDDV